MNAPVSTRPVSTAAGDRSRATPLAWRLLRKTLIVAAIVIVVIVAAIQIVLWTHFPRRIVLRIIQDQLGLRVTARSLSTGWLGHTELHDVTLSLPLADKPFLELSELDVHHTWLPGILLDRPFSISSLDLTRPKIEVRQSPAGRWNVQEAIDLATSALSSSANSGSAAILPEIHVHGATLSLTDNQGRQLFVDPLQVDCQADSAVSWKFHALAQDRLEITGRVAPAAQWQHRLTMTGQNLSAWIHPWAPQLPDDINLKLDWSGQISGGGLTGSLGIDQLTIGQMSASGRVAATLKQTSPVLLLQPNNLVLNTAHSQIGSLQFLSGAITFNGHTFNTDSLDVAAFGGPINLKGWIDPRDQIGEMHAAWRQLVLPGDIMHSGSATLHLSRPFVTLLVADMKLDSTGQTPAGSWSANLALSAQGSDWVNLDWRLNAPALQWVTSRETKKIEGLVLAGQLRQPKAAKQPKLTLDSMTVANDSQVSGQGNYNFADQSWNLHSAGARWPLHPIEGIDFSYVLDAGGDVHQTQLRKLSLTSGLLKLDSSGTYRYGFPRPVRASLSLNNAGEEQSVASKSVVSGQLAGDAGLEGTLLPLNLSMSGRLAGTDVNVRGRPIGDLNLVFDGKIDSDKIEAQTKTLRFLGGDWDLHLLHSLATDASNLGIKVQNLALADVGDLVGAVPMGGRLSGKWELVAPNLRFDVGQMQLTGDAIASGGVFLGPRAVADQVRFTTRFENGQLRLNPITFQRGDYGRGSAQISWKPAQPLHIDGGCSLSAWPVDLPEQQMTGNVWLGLNQLAIDLPIAQSADSNLQRMRFNAPVIDLRVNLNHDGSVLSDVHIVGTSTDRVLDFKELKGTLLGGTIDGSGHFDLDQPQTSQAKLNWGHLDSQKLTAWLPETNGLAGEMNGAATLAAATTSRALAPMAFTIHNDWTKGSFRTLPLADATINGFADFGVEKEARGERSLRIVLDDDRERRSTIHFGQGTAMLWGRMSRHANKSLSVQAQLSFVDFGLDALLHAADPGASATAGKVAGSAMILFDTDRAPHVDQLENAGSDAATGADVATETSPDSAPSTRPAENGAPQFREILDRIYCEGTAKLSEANLANVGFVSILYNTLNVFQKANQPTGNGTVQFRVEHSTLLIPAMRYFNKGTEIRAQLRFRKVWAMPDCRVDGTAVGVARPLGQIKLPFLQDIDTAFTTLQSSLLTSVSISGTVAHPKNAPLLFKNIGTDFQRFFRNDYNDASAEPEGQ